jgi:hypothetical protein
VDIVVAGSVTTDPEQCLDERFDGASVPQFPQCRGGDLAQRPMIVAQRVAQRLNSSRVAKASECLGASTTN